MTASLRAVSRTELISNARPSISREWGFLGAAGAYLAACFFLGGATRSGFAADAVLQLLAVPLLILSLWRLETRGLHWPLALCLALVLVPLAQLIPLPPQIWTALPLRDLAVQSLTLAGEELGWRPLSLTPHGTWLTLCALIPPLAVFLATLQLSWRDRRGLILLLLGLGVLSSVVGLLQVARGPGGTPIGFGLETPGEATGFFANRNHFAALLYSLLIFSAAFAINSTKALGLGAAKTWETRALVAVVLAFVVLVVFLAGQMMARSRAGLGLTMVALVGAAALASSDERNPTGVGAKRLVGGAVMLVLLFASQFALFRMLERFEADPLADARVIFARRTWDAALTVMPFGTGLGSFVPVYQSFERPQHALMDTYANRAHNDVLETWLETGVVGLVLMALFAGWLLRALWRSWRSDAPKPASEMTDLDRLLVRAASLIVVLLSAHSLVDYPLRTTAMSAVFAFACGLLFAPARVLSDAEDREPELRNEHAPRSPGELREPERAPQSQGVAQSGSTEPSAKATRSTSPMTIPWPEQVQFSTGDVATDPASPQTSAKPHDWAWPHGNAAADVPTKVVTPKTERPSEVVAEPGSPSVGNNGPQPGERWGTDIAWPDAWRRSAKPDPNDRDPDL